VGTSARTALVGLPNVGKSTLLNAAAENKAAAQTGNFPFCTIEPNTARVIVPDHRLHILQRMYKTESETPSIVPATLEIMDVAGLVQNAASGEGLGNKFLADIRGCDAIIHVVRLFEDPDVIHVDENVAVDGVDPAKDAEIVNAELALADLEALERRHVKLKAGKVKTPNAAVEREAVEKLIAGIVEDGKAARAIELSDEEMAAVAASQINLLSMKPMIYAANVSEDEFLAPSSRLEALEAVAAKDNAPVIRVSAEMEAEIIDLPSDERLEFLTGGDEELMANLSIAGSDASGSAGSGALINEVQTSLGLRTFLTAGENEVRAWQFVDGENAAQCAGRIHTDMEKGFIKAEVLKYEDLMKAESVAAARSKNFLSIHGREYPMMDGDICLFRFR